MIARLLAGHDGLADRTWASHLDETNLIDIVDYIRERLMLPAPVADASAGRQIYSRSCSVCHGERGDAASWAQGSLDPAPADFTALAGRLGREDMIWAVTYGKKGTAMMPFTTQLSAEDIAAVVDYIRATFMVLADPPGTSANSQADHHAHHGAQAAAGSEHDHSSGRHGHAGHGSHTVEGSNSDYPGDLLGNVAAGKAFYEKNCAECHGADGKGDGPRAYFMYKKPADFSTPESRHELNRSHLFEAIAKGVLKTEMPAWEKVLTPQEIANVAEYVYLAFIDPSSSGTRDGPLTWQPVQQKKN